MLIGVTIDGHGRDRPEGAERPDDDIPGRRRTGRGQCHLEHAECALEQDHDGDENELPDLDADVEEQERQRDFVARQPKARQAAREPEAVQQPERERDDPWVADRKARLAAPDADDLRPEEQDRQRDRGVERRRRHAEDLEGRSASVRLCATVNAVMVFTSVQRSRTMSSSPSTKSRWSTPSAMCSMPRIR